MKVNKLIFGLILMLLSILYFVDKELYYFGRNSFDIYGLLPLKIKPAYWGFDQGNLGFVLLDNYEITLIANGSKYNNSDIVIKEILKYGFNKNELTALIEDDNSKKFYVKCEKNNKVKSKRDLEISVFSIDKKLEFENYLWIDIKTNVNFAKNKELTRNYLLLVFLISITILSFRIFNLKRKKFISLWNSRQKVDTKS
jgi:hypothetical protein